MNRYHYLLPIVAALTAGCDPISERDCGVFDHPDLAAWQADTAASHLMFMSSDGTTINFSREAPVFNEPFLAESGAANDEDVICSLTAEFTMTADDGSLTFISSYVQEEQLLLDSDDEALLFINRVEAPLGTELTGSYSADISIDRTRVNLGLNLVEYLPEDETTEEINGHSYEDVVRINALVVANDPVENTPASIDYVQQIVVAREFGIIAFTDNEEREFVRVAN